MGTWEILIYVEFVSGEMANDGKVPGVKKSSW